MGTVPIAKASIVARAIAETLQQAPVAALGQQSALNLVLIKPAPDLETHVAAVRECQNGSAGSPANVFWLNFLAVGLQ